MCVELLTGASCKKKSWEQAPFCMSCAGRALKRGALQWAGLAAQLRHSHCCQTAAAEQGFPLVQPTPAGESAPCSGRESMKGRGRVKGRWFFMAKYDADPGVFSLSFRPVPAMTFSQQVYAAEAFCPEGEGSPCVEQVLPLESSASPSPSPNPGMAEGRTDSPCPSWVL